MTAEDARRARRRRSAWLIAVATLVAAALVGGGWFAARVFTSPEQRAAAAAAPSPKPINVRVESGDLADTRTLTGTIRPTDSFSASLAPLKEADRSVVTAVKVTAGQQVAVGSVIATVNGQPVFAISSPFALYRDLGPGDHGVDVRALQESLVATGLLASADGVFGPATAGAVTTLFARAGFEVPLRDAATSPAPTDAAPTGGDAGATSPGTKPAQVVYFPASAALAVPSLPAVAASVPAVGADVASGPEFEFSAQALAVFTTPPASLPEGLAPGTKLTVSGGGLVNAPATVRGPTAANASAQTPAASGGAGDGDAGAADSPAQPQAKAGDAEASAAEVRIDLDNPALLKQQQVGQSVTLTATIKEVAKGALLVPVAAINNDDPAHGYVVVDAAGHSAKRVAVTILGAVGGRVAIKAGESLAAGDEVRIG